MENEKLVRIKSVKDGKGEIIQNKECKGWKGGNQLE